MRYMKLSIVAVVVASLAVPGSAAAKSGLNLTENGTPVTGSTPAGINIAVGNCFSYGSGAAVSGNGSSKVKVAGNKSGPVEASSCPVGVTGEAAVTEAEFSSSGTVKLKGTFTLTAEKCVYVFKKFGGSIAIPGIAYWEGEVEGKNKKVKGGPTCAKSVTRKAAMIVWNPRSEEVFETAVS